MVGDVHRRHGDRLIDLIEYVVQALIPGSAKGLVLLGTHAELTHRTHGQDRKLADRGFGRQHDRIRSVHDGVGDVRDLGARR